MSYLIRELRFYLFGFRWISLLVGFLLYFHFNTYNLVIALVMLSMNTLCTIVFVFNKHKIVALFMIFGDMIFNLFLIYSTGGAKSPFIIYSLTTLMWLGTYLGKRLFSIFVGIYFAATSAFLWMHHPYWKGVTEFSLIFLMAMNLFLVLYYFQSFIKQKYKELFLTVKLFNTMFEEDDIFRLSKNIESVVKKIYSADKVYFCWYSYQYADDRWEYYLLKAKLIGEGLHRKGKPSFVKLINSTGQMEQYFYFPIGSRKESIGGVLIYSPRRDLRKRFNYIFLYLIEAFVLNHVTQLKKRNDIEASVRTETKSKIAQDIHDGIAQQLFYLSTQVFLMKKSVMEREEPALDEMVKALENHVKECHTDVRRYIKELKEEDKHHQLVEAIRSLINRITKNENLHISFNVTGMVPEGLYEMEHAAYRLVEEALNNIVKHAQARNTSITIDVTSIQWTVRLEDDGIGFNVKDQSLKKGYGLQGMEDRINELGGQFSIKSYPSRGTQITAIIPRERRRAHG